MIDPSKLKLTMALALGLGAALLSWLYLDQKEREILEMGETVKIVVASKYIPALTAIDGDSIAWRSIPKAYVPRGAVTDPAEIEGLLSLVPFNYKEPLLFNKLSSSGARLADSIPENFRAFTLGVDAVTGLSGLARPGDFVDLYYAASGKEAPSRSAAILQAVKVLAIGSTQRPSDTPENSNTVTLALRPADCSLVMLAQAKGVLQLSLRPTGDLRNLSTQPSTSEELLSRTQRGVSAPSSPEKTFIIQKK